MSLQNFELSHSLIRELYRDFLVDTDAGKTDTVTAATSKVSGTVPGRTTTTTAAVKHDKGTASSVQAGARSDTRLESAEKRIKYLGGNAKKIAFIVNCATDVYLPEAHLDWLGKMLDACRLNLGDVAIANIAQNQFFISDIKKELQSNAVILLGTEPQAIQLPLNFPYFNLQSYDGIVFLNTPSPDQLNQSTNEAKLLKSKLWVCLQKMFKL
ncbi:MAG TPA: hypothetical protein VGD17_19080 [Chitinophagaceae bacterium]